MTQIVTVNVFEQLAPAPATLQQCGCFVSQGATTLTPGTFQLLTSISSLNPYLAGSHILSSLSWSAGIVTAVASSAHGIALGDSAYITVSGANPAGYNGTWFVTATTTTAFTYALATNPGTATQPGMYTLESVSEVLEMNATFWGQGFQTAVFVLELGIGSPNDGVAALSTYLQNNPNGQYTPGAQGFFYIYMVPRTWDGNAAFLSLIQGYNSTTARTYFFTTTTLRNYTLYPATSKGVFGMIEAYATGVWPANALTAATWASGLVTFDTVTNHNVQVGQWFQIVGCTPSAYNGYYQATIGTTTNILIASLASNPGAIGTLGSLVASSYASPGVGANEFSLAAVLWVVLTYAPSSSNRVPPLSYAFLFGVTPFPVQGTQSLRTTLFSSGANIVGTGAEGGLASSTILEWGKLMNQDPFNLWYATDWAAINSDIDLANAVINGSNNPIAPLYYNQDGINRLQSVLTGTMRSAVTFGLGTGQIIVTNLDGPSFAAALNSGIYDGQIVVNAVPFIPYLQASPGDYAAQIYRGLSVQFVAQLGFLQIVLNLLVTEFAA